LYVLSISPTPPPVLFFGYSPPVCSVVNCFFLHTALSPSFPVYLFLDFENGHCCYCRRRVLLHNDLFSVNLGTPPLTLDLASHVFALQRTLRCVLLLCCIVVVILFPRSCLVEVSRTRFEVLLLSTTVSGSPPRDVRVVNVACLVPLRCLITGTFHMILRHTPPLSPHKLVLITPASFWFFSIFPLTQGFSPSCEMKLGVNHFTVFSPPPPVHLGSFDKAGCLGSNPLFSRARLAFQSLAC